MLCGDLFAFVFQADDLDGKIFKADFARLYGTRGGQEFVFWYGQVV